MIRLWFIPVLAALAASAQLQPEVTEVDRAFEATRAGRGMGFEKIIGLGDAAVPAVSRYLKDKDPDLRSQAVAVLAVIGTPAACEAMVPGLDDASSDNRDRTARALYRSRQKHPPASASGPLSRLVQQGTAEAEAILLLGQMPSTAETKAALETAAKQSKPVHLEGGLPVAASLAAAVASGGELGSRVDTNVLGERLFLLSVLPMVHSSKDLSNMVAYLDDTREIRNTGLPSGAGQRRRLCDAALESLAARAEWKPGFEMNGIRRYSDAELREAKAALSTRYH